MGFSIGVGYLAGQISKGRGAWPHRHFGDYSPSSWSLSPPAITRPVDRSMNSIQSNMFQSCNQRLKRVERENVLVSAIANYHQSLIHYVILPFGNTMLSVHRCNMRQVFHKSILYSFNAEPTAVSRSIDSAMHFGGLPKAACKDAWSVASRHPKEKEWEVRSQNKLFPKVTVHSLLWRQPGFSEVSLYINVRKLVNLAINSVHRCRLSENLYSLKRRREKTELPPNVHLPSAVWKS
jgi:hypothetical protein